LAAAFGAVDLNEIVVLIGQMNPGLGAALSDEVTNEPTVHLLWVFMWDAFPKSIAVIH
jgi:hypothetical protein